MRTSVTSIHFMETPDEAELIENHSGPLMTSYLQSGLISSGIETVKSHSDAVLNEITRSGNLILVHNTFADRKTIREVKKRGNLFWCLCPKSNAYIENKIPPVNLLMEEECTITIGTDSLASNNNLDILEELKVLQMHFPSLSISELVSWATLNGAKALGKRRIIREDRNRHQTRPAAVTECRSAKYEAAAGEFCNQVDVIFISVNQ